MGLSENNIPRNLYKYIVVLFLLTIILRVALAGYYNASYGGIEQNVVYGIQRILSGQPLYQDPAAGAYAVMQYTPLYYYCVGGIARLVNIPGSDVAGIYMLCRALALLFNLLTVCVAALIIRTWRFSWVCSFGFAMPVLILLTTHYYTRGDSMHLFLFSAAVYAYILHSKRRGLRDILLAAFFSACCIMVKQSGILVIGIIGYCLLFTERRYLTLMLYSLCTCGFAYLIADTSVNGDWQAFYRNAYLGLKNGTDLSFIGMMFTSQFFLDIVPCYILGGIIVWLALKRITDKTYRIIATGAALSFAFAVVTGLKIGSSNNYFTEFLFFVMIALPYLLQDEEGTVRLFTFFKRKITVHRFAYIALIIVITSKTVGLFTAIFIEKSLKTEPEEYRKEVALYHYMHQQLHLQEGEHVFFTDRMFLDNIFYEHAIMPNKDVVMQVYATSHTTYDYSAFIAGMNTGLVKYIVTSRNKPDINEWNRYIPFIMFDPAKFRLVAVYEGYSIYAFTPAS